LGGVGGLPPKQVFSEMAGHFHCLLFPEPQISLFGKMSTSLHTNGLVRAALVGDDEVCVQRVKSPFPALDRGVEAL